MRLVVLVAALVVSVAVVAPVASETAAATATTDLLVGDSVMAGLGPDARAVLPNHVFDAKVCRRLVEASCSYRGVRPIPALDVVRAWSGTTDRAIVVAAGYNDGSIDSAVDAVVAEARRQGVPHVVWLTYRVAGGNARVYRSHNAVLAQKAQQYPELTLADWAGYSAGRSRWVADDGLHLTGSGAVAMANLVAAVLGDLRMPVAPGRRVCFPVAGEPGDAAVVNLTPVRARGTGHGVLTSSAVTARPTVSNVNYGLGTIDPNVAVAPIGPDGRVCFHNTDSAWVHLAADHLATIRRSSYSPASPDGTPVRVLDTRPSRSPLAAGSRRCFAVTGRPGDVAIVNLTPVRAAGAGHGVLVSSDVAAPAAASNVNFAPGNIDPNLALAPIGPDGAVCFQNADRSATHLAADHLGTIAADVVTLATATGVPRRAVDTRGGRRVAVGETRCFPVTGDRSAVAIVNLTPVRATGPGHGALLGGGATGSPNGANVNVSNVNVSNVNYAPGTVDPNLGIAPIGAGGDVCFANADRAALDLVADHLVSLDAGAVRFIGPVRVLDTRR